MSDQLPEIIPPAKKNRSHLFQPGQSGNPTGIKGRKPGARRRFSEQFCEDLLSVWEEHGKIALIACAKENPTAFCAIASKIVPREYGLDSETREAADSWIQNIARLSKLRAQEALRQ